MRWSYEWWVDQSCMDNNDTAMDNRGGVAVVVVVVLVVVGKDVEGWMMWWIYGDDAESTVPLPVTLTTTRC